MASADDKLLLTLRRQCPAKVRVYDAADESRDIAVPQRRRKWDQVIAAIEARPWVRCEMLDKAGAVLGYVDNDGPAAELEDLDGASARGARDVERYLGLMLKAQQTALTFRDREHQELLRGVVDVLRTQTDAIKQLVALYQAQVEVAAAVAYDKATSEAGGDMEQWLKLLEAAPDSIAKLAPMLRLVANGRPSPTTKPKTTPQQPPNGAKP